MAYFSHEVTRDKLSLLYILNQLDIGLTRQQCIDLMLANDWANYFNLITALTELEEEGLIAAIPRPYGQAYRITQEARAALEMFQARIPITLRRAYDDYIAQNRERLTRETQLVTSIKKEPSGRYLANLKVVEGDRILFELTLQAPTYELARAACTAWPQQAERLFHTALDALMGDPAPSAADKKDSPLE